MSQTLQKQLRDAGAQMNGLVLDSTTMTFTVPMTFVVEAKCLMIEAATRLDELQQRLENIPAPRAAAHGPGTYLDELTAIQTKLKFLAVALVQRDEFGPAGQILNAVGLLDDTDLPADLEDREWDGIP